MPLYDYTCKRCDADFTAIMSIADRAKGKCPQCGTVGTKLAPKKAPAAVNFRAGFYEHIADKPIYCSTPQELRDACDEHNARSVYLENSSFKTSPGPDPDPNVRGEVRAQYGLPADRGDSGEYLLGRGS